MNKRMLVAIALLLVFLYMVGSINYAWCFDTSDLMDWCSPRKTVRMIGAEYFDMDALIDENGNIWNVDLEEDFDENAFYLIWIGDGNTPRDVTDDEVLKVWREVL